MVGGSCFCHCSKSGLRSLHQILQSTDVSVMGLSGTYVCMHGFMCVCICVSVRVYVYVYSYVYVYRIRIRVYVYVYVYISLIYANIYKYITCEI